MSRPIGSQNKQLPPETVYADASERLDYLAALLLEIVEKELL
ncbi:MAG: hypothetical protein ABIQ04_00115 [Candidatus Saccharimonadales bacterium]